MLPKAEKACFAIADISGYTHFVSGVELDHAQDIIADIMDTLVRALRPPFRLAKFEGDAAFVYALADKVDGSLMQDSIEQAYFAFRKPAGVYHNRWLESLTRGYDRILEACLEQPRIIYGVAIFAILAVIGFGATVGLHPRLTPWRRKSA